MCTGFEAETRHFTSEVAVERSFEIPIGPVVKVFMHVLTGTNPDRYAAVLIVGSRQP